MRYKLALMALLIALAPVTGSQTVGGEGVNPAAEISLPALFSDHMVVQRDKPIKVWGTASPGGSVSVSLGKRAGRACADEDGAWRVSLPSLPAGGPHVLTIKGTETLALSNVMVGEVWICSGQSNMEMPVHVGEYGVLNGEKEVLAAEYPDIRLFTVPNTTSYTPLKDTASDGWKICGPYSVPSFSAVAYFFGRDLHAALGVPVGLIHTSWGGTVAEAWTSEEALNTMPHFRDVLTEMTTLIPKMDSLQGDYERKLAEWYGGLDNKDAGYKAGSPIWIEPGDDVSDWDTMELPTLWESAGHLTLDGFVWFRREVEVPAEWAGRDLTLSLGPINDMDRTWFNGFLVGSTEGDGSVTIPRIYTVPGDHVKAGRNTIAVRVYDMGARGGIYGNPDQLELRLSAEKALSLVGPWQYKIGLDLKDFTAMPQQPLISRNNPNQPAVLYNAMIHPLIPFGFRGAIWYQGESNAQRAYQYRTLFPLMISDWRTRWDQGDFPFLFVQLANWLAVNPDPIDDAWAELREAQTMTLALPNTGMAVTVDIGEADDIHPKNKQDVGKRLALAARHVAYGEKLTYSGPVYQKMDVEGGVLRIYFDHVGKGLVSRGDELKGFAIAGADKKFVWAKAVIDGDTVVVSSEEVANPVAVRYGWAINPVCNLFNVEGLPASPFRTDAWPGITAEKK
jgi:sialate O-acetylesterase